MRTPPPDRRRRDRGCDRTTGIRHDGAQLPEYAAWDALAYLLSGLLVLGLPAWLADLWLGWGWLTPVGLVAGMTAGLALVWVRYGAVPSTDAPRDSHLEDAP